MATDDTIGRRIIRCAVDWSGAGMRLDEYLAGRFTYRSLDEWRERIASGEIVLNGRLADEGIILQLHDSIEYFPGDIAEPEADLSYQIVFEDQHLMVIDKPGNLCVHPSGPFFKHTLWYLLSQRYGAVHLVNRLDRETSGLMLAAKDAATAAKLAKTPYCKEYCALVHGAFFDEPVEAKGFLYGDLSSQVRKKRCFSGGQKPPEGAVRVESCHTDLLLMERCGELSLVKAVPHTGRLHQIRATLYSLGFPLVGDKLYGVDENYYLKLRRGSLDDRDRAALIMPRQALHSASLSFTHPYSGEKLEFRSPLPEDFALAMKRATIDRNPVQEVFCPGEFDDNDPKMKLLLKRINSVRCDVPDYPDYRRGLKRGIFGAALVLLAGVLIFSANSRGFMGALAAYWSILSIFAFCAFLLAWAFGAFAPPRDR